MLEPMRSTSTRRRDAAARSVFILEEHDAVRFALEMLTLACEKLQLVGSAADLRSGARAIAELAPDLVISDIDFTGAASFADLSDIVRAQQGRAVLVLSHHDEERYARPVMAIGARGYLPKERALHQWVHAALHVLDGGTWLSAKAASPDRPPEKPPAAGTP